MSRLRIVIVEHSPILVAGLSDMLSGTPDLELVKVLPDLSMLEDTLNAHRADILLANTLLMGISSSRLLHDVRQLYPSLSVVGLHVGYTDPSLLRLFDALVEMEDSRSVVCGKLKAAASLERKEELQENGDLSVREKDVLSCIAKGQTNKEIADLLNLSIHTVMTHRKNIMRKTGIKSISGLTVYALLNKLIGQDEVK